MSNIDPSNPREGLATTLSVRQNFAAAAAEIDQNVADIASNLASIGTNATNISDNQGDIGQNKTDIAELQPGGGGDFAAFLDGFVNNGSHLQYTGDMDLILFNSSFAVNMADVSGVKPITTGWGTLITDNGPTVSSQTQTFVGSFSAETINREWRRKRSASVWDSWTLILDDIAAPLQQTFYGQVNSATGAITITNGGTTGVRNQLGIYAITFDIAFPNAQYSSLATIHGNTIGMLSTTSITATGFQIRVFDVAGAATDLSTKFIVHRQLD